MCAFDNVMNENHPYFFIRIEFEKNYSLFDTAILNRTRKRYYELGGFYFTFVETK